MPGAKNWYGAISGHGAVEDMKWAKTKKYLMAVQTCTGVVLLSLCFLIAS